jgi:uncharacterized repeat protein (TIGR01451 family)
VSFSGGASGGVPPYNYLWEFGDGEWSTEQNPEHTYMSAGVYAAKLTVTGADGCQGSAEVEITVFESPTVEAIAEPEVCESEMVQFTAVASGGLAPYSYSWDFGDGTTSTEQNPEHTYTSIGLYTAELTVTDARGCQATTTVEVEVLHCLTVTKFRPHGEVTATYTFWYYIYVTNPGDVPVHDVTIVDTLPDGIAPYSVQVSEGGVFDEAAGTVTWVLDVLEAGESTYVWISANTYATAAGSYLHNTVVVDSPDTAPAYAEDMAMVYAQPPPTPTPTATPTATQTPTPTSTPTATPTPTETPTEPTPTPTDGIPPAEVYYVNLPVVRKNAP